MVGSTLTTYMSALPLKTSDARPRSVKSVALPKPPVMYTLPAASFVMPFTPPVSGDGMVLSNFSVAHVGPGQSPVAGSQVPDGQTVGVPGVQVPLVQTSPFVQALLSLHVVPFGAFGFEQLPVAGSQVPATWQESDAVQTFAVPPVQTPVWQASPVVHALLSLHVVPFVFGGLVQRPLVWSQVPTSWHWSVAVQTMAVPPQVPAVQ